MCRGVLIAFAMGVALLGCGPKEVTRLSREAGPPPPLPGGWRTIEVPGLGVTLSTPREWMTLKEMKKEEGEAMGTMLQGLAGDQSQTPDPTGGGMQIPDEAVEKAEMGKGSPSGAALELFKRGVIGEIFTPTKIVVQHTKAPGGTTLKEAADAVASKHRGATRATLILPIGPVEEIRASNKTRDGETGRHIVFVLVDNEDVYQVALQTEQTEETISSIALPVIESFRLQP